MERSIRIVSVLVLVLSVMSIGASAATAAPGQAGNGQNYLVLYKGNSVPSNAASRVAAAGGALVYTYDEIGVAIARSDSASFQSNLLQDGAIEGVSATSGFVTQLNDAQAEELAGDPVPAGFSYQWDMAQIHVPEAHAVNTGSSSVVVGDIDTGLDYTHPALAPNVDFSRSVSCIGGVPNQDPAAWMDHNGHGTHTAGTIAARPTVVNSTLSIVGVAPYVKIAGIKAGNDAGYFFPEAVICAFMWAADHGIAVTNNSYFADPWLFNCRNDVGQRAIWKAEQRAIRYAMSKGVVVVAAMGNENMDLSKRNIDDISPDDSTPITRQVTNACVVIPVEISGVIGVTADTAAMVRASFSNYGVGVADVTAPGSRVWSSYPNNRYARFSGTSMASPHVAGVAALILSQFGSLPPGAVTARIKSTADPMACPADTPACEGGAGYNGFYGHGQVDAFAALTAGR